MTAPVAAAESTEIRTPHGLGPDQILQMATGYWVSKTLYTGLELGVFEQLSHAPRSSTRLAESLDLPYDGVERLVTALSALELIQRDGDVLANTPSPATTTCSTSVAPGARCHCCCSSAFRTSEGPFSICRQWGRRRRSTSPRLARPTGSRSAPATCLPMNCRPVPISSCLAGFSTIG